MLTRGKPNKINDLEVLNLEKGLIQMEYQMDIY
jgi:hypothetical protein